MEESYSNKTTLELYARIWQELKEYWKIFLVSIIAMIIVATTGPLFAALMKPLIDKAFITKNLATMKWIPWAIIGLFLIRGVFNFVNAYLTSYLAGHLVHKMRGQLFAKILRLPAGYYHDHPAGRVMSRVTGDAGAITAAGFNVITVFAKDGMTILGLLIWLFILDWKLTLITFIAIPIVGFSIRSVSERMRRLSRENQRLYGQLTQVIGENIDCVQVVKIYGGSQYEMQRFYDASDAVRRNGVKQTAADSANTGFTQLMIAIALAVIIYLAAVRASHSNFSAGDFLSFLTAMIMLFDPIKRVTGIMQSLQGGIAAAESVYEFLDAEEEHDTGTIEDNTLRVAGRLRFEDVSFQYPKSDRRSIQHFSMSIEEGKMIALVGASGCGKTTLANLIPRFFDIKEGAIYLDDVNIQDYRLSTLRQQIALVSQNVVLFNDTIIHNVAYGECSKATEEEVIQALKAANAWEFVSELPEGIYTLIGQNGAKLSGGQRQRLAIARALLKNAPLLILDEATSALDNRSEKLVQSALDELMKNRTTLVIAHRLSTIEHADLIIVMEEGHVVEVGKHQELLEQKGSYSALYQMQFSKPGSIH